MSDNSSHYAYGSERAGVETVMRLQAVKRWHMIDTTRMQTLAEHSANVALLAYGIAESANSVTPVNFFGSGIMVAALGLHHDLGEVFVGDIPSHTKKRLLGVEELEESVLPELWQQLPCTIDQTLLIKLCDLADGIRFIRLHGVDVTAIHARTGLELQLKEKWKRAADRWNREIFVLVHQWIMFYAYENS